MGLSKGNTNNPGGRPIGSTNKITTALRESIKSFIDCNISNLQKDFDELEPKDRLVFIEKMLKYVIPPLKEIDEIKYPPADIQADYESWVNSLKKDIE